MKNKYYTNIAINTKLYNDNWYHLNDINMINYDMFMVLFVI